MAIKIPVIGRLGRLFGRGNVGNVKKELGLLEHWEAAVGKHTDLETMAKKAKAAREAARAEYDALVEKHKPLLRELRQKSTHKLSKDKGQIVNKTIWKDPKNKTGAIADIEHYTSDGTVIAHLGNGKISVQKHGWETDKIVAELEGKGKVLIKPEDPKWKKLDWEKLEWNNKNIIPHPKIGFNNGSLRGVNRDNLGKAHRKLFSAAEHELNEAKAKFDSARALREQAKSDLTRSARNLGNMERRITSKAEFELQKANEHLAETISKHSSLHSDLHQKSTHKLTKGKGQIEIKTLRKNITDHTSDPIADIHHYTADGTVIAHFRDGTMNVQKEGWNTKEILAELDGRKGKQLIKRGTPEWKKLKWEELEWNNKNIIPHPEGKINQNNLKQEHLAALSKAEKEVAAAQTKHAEAQKFHNDVKAKLSGRNAADKIPLAEPVEETTVHRERVHASRNGSSRHGASRNGTVEPSTEPSEDQRWTKIYEDIERASQNGNSVPTR